jgi:hypothetical protein
MASPTDTRDRTGLAEPAALDTVLESRLDADRLVLAVAAMATVAGVSWVLTAPLAEVVARSTDDAFYYFNVARNVTAGHGWTFDQINRTNGFHPLWMACLLPVFALAGADEGAGLRAAMALTVVVAGAAVWMAYRAASRRWGRPVGLLASGLLIAPPFVNALLCGLETGPLLLLLFGLLWADERYPLMAAGTSAARNVCLGLLLGAVFLCRLDAVFLVAAVASAACFTSSSADGRIRLDVSRRSVWKAAQVGAVLVGLGGAYLAWNVVEFGHLVPISGAVKSSFPVPSFRLARLAHPHVAFGWLQVLAGGLALVWLRSPEKGAPVLRAAAPGTLLTAMWIGNVAHLAYSLLFMNWGVHWWHFASYLPVTAIALALAVARLSRAWPAATRPGRPVLAALGLGALAACWTADAWLRGDRHAAWYESALWAREHLPAGAVVGLADAGVFGYFAGRRTINLDGVINGYEYQDALGRQRLSEYLQVRGVTHVADTDVAYDRGRYVIRVRANRSRRPGAALVAPEEAEVYRSAPYADALHQDGPIHFAIWPLASVQVVEDARTLRAR